MKGDSNKIDFKALKDKILYFDREYRIKICPGWPQTKCMEGYYVWINLIENGLPLYFVSVDPLYSRPDQRSNAPYGMNDKQLFFIHHVDVTDKEIDDLFENVRRFIEWFNPDEYIKRRSQKSFTLDNVIDICTKYGLNHICYDQYFSLCQGPTHLFYLTSENANWFLRFYENQGYVTILKRHKIYHRYMNKSGVYFNDYKLCAGQYQNVHNLTDMELLIQRSLLEYKQKQNEVKILNVGIDFE